MDFAMPLRYFLCALLNYPDAKLALLRRLQDYWPQLMPQSLTRLQKPQGPKVLVEQKDLYF